MPRIGTLDLHGLQGDFLPPVREVDVSMPAGFRGMLAVRGEWHPAPSPFEGSQFLTTIDAAEAFRARFAALAGELVSVITAYSLAPVTGVLVRDPVADKPERGRSVYIAAGGVVSQTDGFRVHFRCTLYAPVPTPWPPRGVTQ